MKDIKSQRKQLATAGVQNLSGLFLSYACISQRKTFQHYLHRPGFENNTDNNVSHAYFEIVCCKCYDEDTHSSVSLGPFCGGVECIDGKHPLKREKCSSLS
jgi:hypothetical protein